MSPQRVQGKSCVSCFYLQISWSVLNRPLNLAFDLFIAFIRLNCILVNIFKLRSLIFHQSCALFYFEHFRSTDYNYITSNLSPCLFSLVDTLIEVLLLHISVEISVQFFSTLFSIISGFYHLGRRGELKTQSLVKYLYTWIVPGTL